MKDDNALNMKLCVFLTRSVLGKRLDNSGYLI